MKKIILFCLISLMAQENFAQEFKKGTQVGSLGVGIGGVFGSYTTTKSTPAISLQYERGIWGIGEKGVISLGGYLGYRSFKYTSSYYNQSWNYTIIGLRSAYHYNGFDVKNLDPYAGLMLGYNYLNYKYDGPGGNLLNGTYGSTVGLSGYIGSRYYLNSDFAAFAELGFGISYLTIGAAYRF